MSLADIRAMSALKKANKNTKDIYTRKVIVPPVLKSLPTVMASPPTVTVTKSDTSGITNAQKFSAGIPATTNINPIFRYTGDIKRADWNGTSYSGTYPSYNYVRNTSILLSNGVTGFFDVEFAVDDSSFEIIVQGSGQSTSYRILVDEGQGYQAVFADPAPTSIPNDSSMYQILLTFSARKIRRIRFQSAPCGFAGVNVGPNGTVFQLGRPLGTKAIFLGDSFTEGTGANGFFNGYAPIISQMMGWEYWISGSGGTGYINSNSSLFRLKYQDRVQRDVIGYNPDIVIIQGGQNDTTYTPSDITNAALLLYQTIQSSLPNTQIIVLGNIAISAETTAITQTRDAIKLAALQAGVPYIDSIAGVTYDAKGNALYSATGDWFSGLGTIGNVQPTGNRSYYTWTDSGHPSNDGHRYIGERVAFEIYNLLNK